MSYGGCIVGDYAWRWWNLHGVSAEPDDLPTVWDLTKMKWKNAAGNTHRLGGEPALFNNHTRTTDNIGFRGMFFIDGVEFPSGTCDEYLEAEHEWILRHSGRLTKGAVGR
jgi:hypothetical protein